MLYSSQSVAVLGVLGAFITPLLIGGELDAGIFPLVYIALINVPVILLGVRRKWQVLYNLAFCFTIIHFLIWMDRLGRGDFAPGLVFAIVLYLQYALLGLLKLRQEQDIYGRSTDLVRLIAASLLLPGAVYWLFAEAGHDDWTALAFVGLALLQFAVAGAAWKLLRRFAGEITAFVAGGLFALAMALPVHFDGEWVSLGWGIEGVLIAWFAVRVRSRPLQAGAFLLGLIGLFKVLVYDIILYDAPPGLFLNARFGTGLLSVALLGLQGRLAARMPEDEQADHWCDAAWWIGSLAAVFFFFSDVFWTLGPDEPYSWLLTSLVLLLGGSVLVLFAPKNMTVLSLGCLLLLAVPIKLFLVDSVLALEAVQHGPDPFANTILWIQLLMLGLVVVLIQPRLEQGGGRLPASPAAMACAINLASLASGLGLLSLETGRLETDWADMAITILWAVSALILILFGMKRRRAAHRYFGLVLIGLAALKVLIIDSSELDGLQRIGAFIGTGILLLLLAFAYQKASAWFQGLEGD